MPDSPGTADTLSGLGFGAVGPPEFVRLVKALTPGGLAGAPGTSEGVSAAEPKATPAVADAEFPKPVSGDGNPVTRSVLRKTKISGDVGPAAGPTRLSDIPEA
jgi:hypothetical protein